MKATVCFTGHRTIPKELILPLKTALDQEIEQQIARGVTVFRAGGAIGFDTLAAQCVLSARRFHPNVRLELILPYPEQAQDWSYDEQKTYEEILRAADAHRYVAPFYFSGALQLRNQALVRGADVCIAYLRNSSGGGAAYTASLALREGLEFINLYDQLPR